MKGETLRYREQEIEHGKAVQVSVPFAIVESSKQSTVIVTQDDEWLSDEQLAALASRRRKQRAVSRKTGTARSQKRVDKPA
ncbi:MAG: hypothetical protein AAGF31_00830 [Planctomycetota bacterium]